MWGEALGGLEGTQCALIFRSAYQRGEEEAEKMQCIGSLIKGASVFRLSCARMLSHDSVI